jgi:hypothetical protein
LSSVTLPKLLPPVIPPKTVLITGLRFACPPHMRGAEPRPRTRLCIDLFWFVYRFVLICVLIYVLIYVLINVLVCLDLCIDLCIDLYWFVYPFVLIYVLICICSGGTPEHNCTPI